MIDLEAIFGLRRPDRKKLEEDGFEKVSRSYVKNMPILDERFLLEITVDVAAIDGAGYVDYRVMEKESGEEYQLVKVPSASGIFLGTVEAACEAILQQVTVSYFERKIYHSSQTKAVLAHVKDVYNVTPEFLWKQYPTYGVFRAVENRKWFGVIMTLEREKLGRPASDGGKAADRKMSEELLPDGSKSPMAEVIVLKGKPDDILQRVDDKTFFPGFHMNKKHWYTVLLDGTLSDQELWQLIADSYRLVR